MPSNFLYMPLKVPVRYDLVKPLAKWLDGAEHKTSFAGNGGGNDDDMSPDAPNPLVWVVPKPSYKSSDCHKELVRLAALRNCLSEQLQDSHKAALHDLTTNGLEDCQEYHATLLEFEKQGFPTAGIDDEMNGIAMTWKGAFATKQKETHYSLVWDRACTLWNVAALQSFVGTEDADTTKREGCKLAIAQFQSAANNLSILQQLSQADNYSTVDLSQSMLSFWSKLLLAQAQTSIYKLANLGETGVRQHTTLAYLVQAAAGLYNEALALAQDPRLQSELPKQSTQWSVHCKAQSLICQARAVFHVAIDHRQKKDHGPEIARLEQSIDQLKECLKFCKGAKLSTPPEVDGLMKLAQDRLERAAEENRKIYMDEIPKDLPEIKSQLMVKTGVPLATNMTVTKVPLFEFTKLKNFGRDISSTDKKERKSWTQRFFK